MKRIPLLLMILLLCSSGIKTNSSLNENGLKGKVKEVRDYFYGYGKTDTVLYAETASTYDMMGNEAYRKQYAARTSADLPMTSWRHRYNNDSNKIEEKVCDSDGTLKEKITFIYDHDSKLMQTTRYGHDGGLLETCLNEVDARGNKTACACYTGMGKLIGRWTYTYDAQNNLLQEREDSGEVKSMRYDMTEAITWWS